MLKRTAVLAMLLLCIPVFSLTAEGAAAGRVRGVIVDESTRRPMPYVNVTLQKKADSLIVTGTVTDAHGAFDIVSIEPGEYHLHFSIVGYADKFSAPFAIDSRRASANLGTIMLTESSVAMDEVLVTSQKALLNSAIDRKVYNVDQDVVSKAGSVSELLQNVPAIEVDIEGNVSLRGSTPLILVNGKTSTLMEKSSATVLQQMPASSIERIEVITNPSAKYKPDGTSGIINIVLKKNTAPGLNGSIGANAGNLARTNGNVRLNYNPGDYNLFATYSVRKDTRNRTNMDSRLEFAGAVPGAAPVPVGTYRDDQLSFSHPLSHMVSLGGEYKLDESTTAGASGNYFYNGFTRTENSVRLVHDAAGVLTNRYGRDRLDYEFEKESGYNLFAEHIFGGEDHKLRVEWEGSHAPETEDNHYTDVYWFPAAQNQFDNALIRQGEDKDQLNVEYSNPFSEHTKFEAGYRWEKSKGDFDFYVEAFDNQQGRFVMDAEKTNRFLFDEGIHAAYATLEQSFGKFGLLGGLRAEQVYRTSDFVTLKRTMEKEYFKLYPTLHLAYEFSDEAELQLNYSLRTHRPDGDDLNPFPEYKDARNMSAGNPNLLPEYISSVELGCKLQNDRISILPSVFYRYTTNKMSAVTRAIDDSTLLSTKENLANDRSAGVEMIVSASIGETITSHLSGNAYYSRIDASNLGYSANKSIIAWSGAFTFNLHLSRTSMMQLNSNYNSAHLTPQGKYRASYGVNIGFRQELMEGQLSLIATMADVFKTVRREYELESPFMNQTVINARDSQVIYLGVAYHFGATAKRSKDDTLKYDDGI